MEPLIEPSKRRGCLAGLAIIVIAAGLFCLAAYGAWELIRG